MNRLHTFNGNHVFVQVWVCWWAWAFWLWNTYYHIIASKKVKILYVKKKEPWGNSPVVTNHKRECRTAVEKVIYKFTTKFVKKTFKWYCYIRPDKLIYWHAQQKYNNQLLFATVAKWTNPAAQLTPSPYFHFKRNEFTSFFYVKIRLAIKMCSQNTGPLKILQPNTNSMIRLSSSLLISAENLQEIFKKVLEFL